MEVTLTPVEIRVLGCLVEKEATTPAAYPLSRNALTTACNQKTSRDPVMNLSEADVQAAVDSLIRKTLAIRRGHRGGRVARYAHCLHDRLNQEFDFSRTELAVMATLFLRGPQTRGEIRSRCARIYEFDSSVEVDDILRQLQRRPDGPYVRELPVEPGQKEARYMHLAGGDKVAPAPRPSGEHQGARPETEIDRLRKELAQARAELAELRRQLQKDA